MTRKAPGSGCRRSFSLEMLFSYVVYATLNVDMGDNYRDSRGLLTAWISFSMT
jgi:hypothetical protein